MIIVKLMGGLGNQMFQYALAKKLSLKNNSEIVFDFQLFKLGGRQYALSSFDLNYREVSNWEKHLLCRSVYKRLPYQLMAIICGKRVIDYREKSLEFDNVILGMRGDMCIEGYWQSEKYFNDIRSELLTDFKIKNNLSGENLKIANSINESNTAVSLHIRRGDYITNKNANTIHGICDLDYYYRAIKYIAKQNSMLDIFVFSDDINWVKENLKVSHNLYFVDNNTEETGAEDLRLMSLCKHNIIANSSFSWWGAWLNRHKDKIVVAPKRWFKDASKNSSDLVPESWKLL